MNCLRCLHSSLVHTDFGFCVADLNDGTQCPCTTLETVHPLDKPLMADLNTMIFRRLTEAMNGIVCNNKFPHECEDPAKYLVITTFNHAEIEWTLCADHARDILYYQIGHL